ncbi:hypothetical protein RJ639_044989 [Escallonia herrerae]|uniref:CASP-like protein n=1 Tax=Escallonia herrerae TaxID=1293975 RepID=A0AA89B0T3_9ASTE|nr:hypothetical protein RJ639_044989 [Escallonia herrerae]
MVTIMGLVVPWSFTLALVDGYSVLVECPIRRQGIQLVLSILTLAAACSTTSVVARFCNRYLISAVMAFLAWFLSAASSLFNL